MCAAYYPVDWELELELVSGSELPLDGIRVRLCFPFILADNKYVIFICITTLSLLPFPHLDSALPLYRIHSLQSLLLCSYAGVRCLLYTHIIVSPLLI